MSGPRVQTYCIKKDIYGCHSTCKYLIKNDAFLFQKKDNKILFGPSKKAQGYERSPDGYMHKCLSIPAAHDLDIY